MARIYRPVNNMYKKSDYITKIPATGWRVSVPYGDYKAQIVRYIIRFRERKSFD